MLGRMMMMMMTTMTKRHVNSWNSLIHEKNNFVLVKCREFPFTSPFLSDVYVIVTRL
jgi:hypothetical protein